MDTVVTVWHDLMNMADDGFSLVTDIISGILGAAQQGGGGTTVP
jgi:hypothetical protein